MRDDDQCIKLKAKNFPRTVSHTQPTKSKIGDRQGMNFAKVYALTIADLRRYSDIASGNIGGLAGRNEAWSKIGRSTVVFSCFSLPILLGMFPLEHKNSWREKWGGLSLAPGGEDFGLWLTLDFVHCPFLEVFVTLDWLG